MRLIDADALRDEWLYKAGKFEPNDVLDSIDYTPTIDPVKWIPATEGLPEEEVQVLVTDDAGGFATIDVDCGYFDKEYGRFEWFHSQNVTAWMPLPEPWRGEE